MKKFLMACLMALGIFAWGNAGITPAEAADYYVSHDEYNHQYWVVSESISHVSDWAECDVKLVNSNGKFLCKTHYTFGISNGSWVYKQSNDYSGRWHNIGDSYIMDVLNFVMSH